MKRKGWDAHEIAKDPGFRPAEASPSPQPPLWAALPSPAGGGSGVACKTCGGDQVIPIPIWGLMAESEHDKGMLEVPVALVCLECGAQSLYQAKYRPDPEGTEDRDGN